jgi:dihydroorotate dehydrogenase
LIACGATHVALGTVLFADPDAPSRVRDELAAELVRLGFDTVDDAAGVALESVANAVNSVES